MEHLHNFLKEIQSFTVTKELYYGLPNSEKAKHIHHSELKEGQEYNHECHKISIPESYVSDEYKAQLNELANIALTEALLLTEDQQLNIIARLRLIKQRITDKHNGISTYIGDNNKGSYDRVDIYKLLHYSFPLAIIPCEKIDLTFNMRLCELINSKIEAIDYLKNSLWATYHTVDSFTDYGKYKPSKIKDPYLIIDCATTGLYHISQQFKEQIRGRMRIPDNATTGKMYTKKDMIPINTTYTFYVAQELPFIDFALFKTSVRKLLLNVPNKDELKNILQASYRVAKLNVDTYLNTIVHLEELRGNKNSKKVPDEYRGIEVTADTKYLTFTKENTILTHYEMFAENDMTSIVKMFWNRDFAVHSEKVLMFLNNEIFKEEEPIKPQVPEANDFLRNTIDEYLEPVKEAIREYDYKAVTNLFFSYFKDGRIEKIEPVFVRKGNTVALALAFGQLFKALKEESISYEYLMLLKNTFQIFSSMVIDKDGHFKSTLYKHCNRKK